MLITNFSSGELSPTLNGRTDLQQYYQGAGYLKNFEIIPTGGIKRRVGMKRLALTDKNARLIPFIVNKNLSFILELYAKTIRIWYMQNNVFTVLQTVTTDYTETDIADIQYAQNYDIIVLTHRSYKPIAIIYNGAISLGFSKSEITFDTSPDCNLDDDYGQVMVPTGTLAALPVKDASSNKFTYYKSGDTEGSPSGSKTYKSGQTPYCVYKGHLYEYINYWQVQGTDPEEAAIFSSENNYPGCVAFYNNRLFLASTKNNPQKIWASCAPDSEDNRYYEFSTYQKYVTVERVVKEADLHIFTCDISVDNKKLLTNVSQDFTNAILADGKSITDYYVTGTNIEVGTKVVSVTANTITLDHNASITEDVTNQVCSIQLWMKADAVSADDYDYQVVNNNVTTADCSFNFELASDENDAIMFITSGNYLAVGTESSIWSISSDCTATNITAQMQGRYGSDSIQGMAVATAQIYFAQGRRGIREFYYDNAAEAFQTNNIAITAEQMLEESNVIDFDYITNPYNKVLCLRNDGVIAQLLYDKNNGVMGWSRLVRGQGTIKNVAVIRGNEQYDLPFFLIEDDGHYYIEMLDPNQEVYLDSWSLYTGDTSGYTSDAILWNETQETQCNINDIPDGFITADTDVVYIGYKFESDIKSLPVLANDPTGKKRITSLLVRFLNSYLPVMKYDTSEETFSGVTEPYSGIVKMTYPGIYDRDVTFEIKTDKPRKVVILAVNAQLAS